MKTIVALCLVVAIARCANMSLNGNWSFRIGTNTTYYPAEVPSTIHLDLIRHGILKDPYFGANLLDAYWIETMDVYYNKTFDIPAGYLQNNRSIVFEGLDTHCDVYINGKKILHANNMFRKWRAVGEPGNYQLTNNNLTIHFLPSAVYDVNQANSLRASQGFDLPANYSFTRKAAYQYGWDWGPRLLTVGIWKDVSYEFYTPNVSISLESFSIRNSDVTRNSTTVQINITTEWTLDPKTPTSYSVVIANGSTVVASKIQKISGNRNRSQIILTVDQPILWWTRDVGKPFLYNIILQLQQGLDVVFSKTIKYGIRTVKVQQQNNNTGTEFTVELNGQRMFMRGGNYIPPDMFMPRAKNNPKVYEDTIAAAVFANFNMLRVWGGGQFDHDIFYDMCDQNGLLIWHDLMFACAMYPGSDEIYENIRQEMIDNIMRLRHHPSIALWNGNNEVWIGWQEWGWKSNKTASQQKLIQSWYIGIFASVLKSVIREYDPDRFYWETSPSSSSNTPSTIGSGDIHFWRVWGGGTDIEEYEIYVGRFNSEYGMQSMLEYSSILRFTEEKDRTINSLVMRIHQRHIYGEKFLPMYTSKYVGTTNDLERYSYFSQIMQAHALSTAINSLRGARPFCMGSLYWQLNDVWPVSSWATVDYYGMYKAAHYTVRDLYWPLQAVVRHNSTNKTYTICAINDNIGFQSFAFSLQIIYLNGTIIQPKTTNGYNTAAGTNSVVSVITEAAVQSYANSSVLIMSIDNPSKMTNLTWFYYFRKPVDLVNSPPNITINWLNDTFVNVSTTTMARSVYLFDKTRAPLLLKDNYFDIAPNGFRVVELSRRIDKQALGWKEYFNEMRLSNLEHAPSDQIK